MIDFPAKIMIVLSGRLIRLLLAKHSLIFCLLFLKAGYSQQIKVTSDLGAWIGANVEKELFNNFDLSFNQQVRLYTNATELDDYFFELGGHYKMNKNFGLAGNLRYTYNAKRWQASENNYRYNLDFKFRGKLNKKWKLHYRLRFQREHVNIFSEYLPEYIPNSGIRNMVKVKYKINKKNKLFFSAELFRKIESFKAPYYNRLRFLIGDDFQSNVGFFNLAIGCEQEINTAFPLTFFFTKVIYKLKL